MSKKITILFSVFILFLTGLISSCASTTEESIERITIGMSKAVVLDIVGDPSTTSRTNSVDEWVYKYYSNDFEKKMMVLFKGGRVIKVKNYDPNEGDSSNSYRSYSKKIKSERKQKDSNFKNLDD